MNAIIQTIETTDGPFTILADEHQRVLSSGSVSYTHLTLPTKRIV